MIILTIDSAMNGCAAGVFDDSGCLGKKSIETSRGQAEHLIPIVDKVISKAGIKYSDIDRIAVTVGPGAFTGIRIGLAAAKTFGLALQKPVFGVCTFQAVFHTYRLQQNSRNGVCCVLLETKRHDYYAQLFDIKNENILSKKMIAPAEVIKNNILDPNTVIVGDAISRFHQETDLSGFEKDEFLMADPEALDYIARRMTCDQANADPVYLREPEIGVPKNPPRTLKQ
ncbi:MAG: tRNA (adenosine(37)-N6)-threonylcarbamoyltransferase complex dimerization subunit type 1 TsaB [Alphaproteobacteria bacterium]|nr:tRNA (adenosine(37)-N6)-threonylcarbamoyltransferase complex dimerization subunit type 1 TsaB [Alphaproteobacteria bacterium]